MGSLRQKLNLPFLLESLLITIKPPQETTKRYNVKFFIFLVFINEDLDNLCHINSYQYNVQFSNISVTTEQVYCKLRSLKPFKSPGPDGFHPRILKEATEQLSFP